MSIFKEEYKRETRRRDGCASGAPVAKGERMPSEQIQEEDSEPERVPPPKESEEDLKTVVERLKTIGARVRIASSAPSTESEASQVPEPDTGEVPDEKKSAVAPLEGEKDKEAPKETAGVEEEATEEIPGKEEATLEETPGLDENASDEAALAEEEAITVVPDEETAEAPEPARRRRKKARRAGKGKHAGLVKAPGVAERGGRDVLRNRTGLTNGRGLVNGVGLVNGGGRNGMRNRGGLTNGKGLSNGNGLLNGAGRNRRRDRRGLTNGNGLSNGNGLVNGSRNGITNGSRRGMVNGRGIINGNGITNGRMMALDEAAPQKRKRAGWVAAAVVAVLLLAAVLSAFLLISNEKGIRVDGSFSDWSGVARYPDHLAAPSNPDIRIRETALSVDDSSVSFYVRTEGKALQGSNGGIDSAYFFIDADRDASTGYRIGSVGAEYVLAVDGYDGRATAAAIYRFPADAGRPGNDWNSRTATGSARAAAGGSELEAQVPLSDIGMGGGGRLDAVAYMKDSSGAMDLGVVMCNGNAALKVEWLQTGPATVPPGSTGVPALQIRITALGGNAAVSYLRIHANDGTTGSDVSRLALCSASGLELPGAAGPLVGGMTVLTPVNPIMVTTKEAAVLTVKAWFPADAGAGRAVGIRLESPADISADTRAVTVTGTARQMTYIGAPAGGVRIDGAFSDWDGVPAHPDPKGDVADPNIDVVDFRVTNDTASLFFYAQVDGNMMGGSGIPEGKLRPSGGSGGGGGGPVALPILAGEDAFFLFVDSDGEADTGYSGGGLPVGADFMVKITGQYGRILERKLHSFTGGADRGKWSWDDGKEVSAATDTSRLEAGVALAGINSPKGNISLFYYTTDWKALKDGGEKLGYDLRAPGGGRAAGPQAGEMDMPGNSSAGRFDPKPLHAPEFRDLAAPMAGIIGLFAVLRKRFSQKRARRTV